MILDTRPAIYRARMAQAYAAAPVPVLHWPVLVPQPTATAWPDPHTFDALLLTSQIPIAQVPSGWQDHVVYAVGDGTEEAARAAGFATVIRTGLDGADMLAALKTATFRRGFYPSAKDVSVDLALAFPEKVERRAVYEMVAAARIPDAIAERLAGQNVIAPLFSRRSAAVLGRLLAAARLDVTVDAVAISAAVLDAPPSPWRRKIVAPHPTLAAITVEVLRLAQEQVSS